MKADDEGISYAHNDAFLVRLDSIKGAEYNPRKRIPERFEKLIGSIKHLGFVLPLYVTESGTILSGHQRAAAARELGYTKVPVVNISVRDYEEKGMNLFFNRATNDFEGIETSKALFDKWSSLEASIVFDNLPVIEPDTRYPCMEFKQRAVNDLMPSISAPSTTAYRSALTLLRSGVHMPIVVCGNRVLNGGSRVYVCSYAGYTHLDTVEVDPSIADYAQWVLNAISMDFNIQESFADELRYNAFRRLGVQAQMVGFSRTYSYFVFNRTVRTTRGSALTAEDISPDLLLMPHLDEEVKKKYLAVYGDTVIDYGAGTYHDAELLRKGGFRVLAFEPYAYPKGSPQPSIPFSKAQNKAFLEELREIWAEDKVTSIISSYVLNSIPHHKDRMAYLAILAATGNHRTTCFIGTQHIKVRGRDTISANLEPNMTIGDTVSNFKTQKFFLPEELKKMLDVYWVKVEMVEAEGTLYAKCQFPRRPKPQLLKEALELEFELPYSDGSRMGLSGLAKEIYGEFHKIQLK